MITSRSAAGMRLVVVGAALGSMFALVWTAAGHAAPQRFGRAHASAHKHKSRCEKEGQKHKVLRVGTYKGKKGPCVTIQEAVNAAKEGDWVLIGPGDYKQAGGTTPKGATGSDNAESQVLITTPNIHVRGMNRNTVMIDGTKPGSPECSSAEANQTFGGRNGVVVYKASGVWLQNFSTCNFLSGSGGGNSVWFDGGGSTGRQAIGSWWGEWLSSTSTYWAGVGQPSDEYGIYASNTYGPGYFTNTYASNMSDSGYYIGACPDCNTIINKAHSEGNDLGYSGSNSGGRVIIENSEFNNNEEGVATQSQNNDDAPSPQDGTCPGGKENPTLPAGAQSKNICWVMIGNRVVNNNNGASPTASGAPGLVGTGMTIAGGRSDLVIGNTFEHNNAWGILVLPYPGLEESPPAHVVEEFPEDECRGGVKAEVMGKPECLYEASANEIALNTFAHNGSFGNPSNGDVGEVANASAETKNNCWHGSIGETSGEPSSEPKLIQTTHGTCGGANTGGEPLTSVLAAQATCDSRLVTECPSVPGEEYPRGKEAKLLPRHEEAGMTNPCLGVPRNKWCH